MRRQIPQAWEAMPLFSQPLEPLSDHAIELFCDADRRAASDIEDLPETMIVRLRGAA